MKTEKIAIQGVKGAFHEEAARMYYGKELEIEPCITFRELAEKLENGEVNHAIMAIENTISGTILANYELIRQHKLRIVGEISMRIRQNLGGIKGSSIDELTSVSSHYMALNQCREFFEKKPKIALIESPDTALSIQQVAESKNPQLGAIGSQLAITHYGLELLAESIETDKQNFTRFAILQREQTEKMAKKVSITAVLLHEPGTLARLLTRLNHWNANLTKIESTPIVGRPFQYRFYLDFIQNDAMDLTNIMKAIQPLTEELEILGIYEPNNLTA